MAEQTAQVPPQEQARPQMQIQAQYVRDLSFENVAMQKRQKIEGKPEIQVQVGLDARRLGDDQYEVIVKTKVDNKTAAETVFLLELEYAGQFKVTGVPENQLHPYLLVECPRMLFPFVRRVISDVTRDGGFPPLNVDTIDFLQLYRQDMERRQKQQAAEGGGSPGNGAASG